MPVQRPPRPLPVLASVLAAAGVVLAVASCTGQITPLGPDPTPVAMPPPRHLGSPIIVQVMRVQPPKATGGCPAGWAAVSLAAGGGPRTTTTAAPVVRTGASAPPRRPRRPPRPRRPRRPPPSPATVRPARR